MLDTSIVKTALKEDIGKRDITTELAIPKDKLTRAILLTKEDCVVCGLDIAKRVFKEKDKKIQFKPKFLDGQQVKKGKVLAKIEGRARSILTAERVALNFLSLLSGIATKTREYIEAIKPHKIKIMDTRKTIPGLRELQKYAVRVGGGHNHRLKLDEMVLIKDNHLKVIKDYTGLPAVLRGIKGYRVELEVKNLKEFKEALKIKPDIIMLDNMSIKDIKMAVMIKRESRQSAKADKTLIEASGGINLKNVRKIAACGVDIISVGDLTHSVKSVNISLEVL